MAKVRPGLLMKSTKTFLGLTACLALACSITLHAAPDWLSAETRSIKVGGKVLGVKMLRVPLDKYAVKVGLAQGKVGGTEPLKGIVKRYNAIAGINGCFFDAYTQSSIKPPYHNLVTGGEIVHTGGIGVTLGFDADGDYRMQSIQFKIRGGLNGATNWPYNWYTYFVNHPVQSTNSATMFTKHWIGDKTPSQGVQVVIDDGKVQSISTGGNSIPRTGRVLLFAGSEKTLASRFHVGDTCEYRIDVESGDAEFWSGVREAIGCGPRLVDHGAITVDPVSEGFRDKKILTSSAQRSAVGITKDGAMLLVTCNGATIRQMAEVMKALGAYDAMNLDGGASSGLYVNGRYLTSPGRDVSNALLIVSKQVYPANGKVLD